MPESETEGPKNLAGKNAALAEDDVDLEPAREKFNQTRADGDTEAKSIFKEEHKAAQQGGAADNQLQSEAAKLKEVRPPDYCWITTHSEQCQCERQNSAALDSMQLPAGQWLTIALCRT